MSSVTSIFDSLSTPAIVYDQGTMELHYIVEFGGWMASYDSLGNPAWRVAARDKDGGDTIVGPTIDELGGLPVIKAYYAAHSIDWETKLDSPPVPETLAQLAAQSSPPTPSPAPSPSAPAPLSPPTPASPATPHISALEAAIDFLKSIF